jgi:hypothetical protein
MSQINQDIFAVSPIRCFKENKEIGQATGFFYYFNSLYIITNRHVIIDENDDYYPDELRLHLHKIDNINQSRIFSVPLYDTSGDKLWLEHPQYGGEVDVIALPIDRDRLNSQYFIKSFGVHDNIPSNIDISIGEDVLVIGYPLGFRDTINNLPIARNATIASVYQVPFEGKPGFLIDSRLHRGTSGSPVSTKPMGIRYTTDGSMNFGGRPRFFLGVHSETVNTLERDPDEDEPLGLNFVWNANLIPELINYDLWHRLH